MGESDSYTCDQIQVLEGLEPVRLRPGMYIGDTRDGSGLQHMVWEVVSNVIDLHLCRRASLLRVDIRGPWVEVEDDGPGLPVAMHGPSGKRAAEVILTTLHAGPTWDGHFPHVHIHGHRGLGLAPVNALSADLEIETHSMGRVWRQRFEQGRAQTPFASHGATSRTGTRVRFRPDPAIFGSVVFDVEAVGRRLRELAHLNPGLTIRYGEHTLRERLGLYGWASRLLGDDSVDSMGRTLVASRFENGVALEGALGWGASGPPRVIAFAQQGKSSLESSHVLGFWDGLRQALGDLPGRPARGMRTNVFREVIGNGLVAVLDVQLHQPDFAGPVRERLLNPEAREVARVAVSDAVKCKLASDESFAAELAARFTPGGTPSPPLRPSPRT